MTNDASQHSYFYFKEKRLTSKRERERKACPEQKMTSASAQSAPEEEEGSCGTCGQPASLKCAGCKLVSYCDKNCQANEKCHLRNCCKNFKILFNLP